MSDTKAIAEAKNEPMDLSPLLEKAMAIASPEEKRQVEAFFKAIIASKGDVAETGEEPPIAETGIEPTAENQEAVGGDQPPIPPGRETSLAGSVVNEQQLSGGQVSLAGSVVNEQQLHHDRAPIAPQRPVSLTGSTAMANDDASISRDVASK